MEKLIFHALLILLVSSLSIITVETVICGSCDLSQCDTLPENCLGGHTPDPCGCCAQCARVINETCGGHFGSLGACDQGLTCVITPANGQPITGHEVGVCLTTNHEETEESPKALCDDCPLDAEHLCPNDSQVIYQETECCPKPSCHCKPCPVEPCPLGHISRIVEASDGSPGSCCDIVECVPGEELCANVTCSNNTRGIDDEDLIGDSSGDPDAATNCPLDSYPLPPELTPDGCCLKHVGCQCKDASECPVPECPPYQQVELQQAGNGTPSQCCDLFACVERDCHHENTTRGHGELWKLDDCIQCECQRGITVCSTVPCPELSPHCIIHSIPEGSCCPECQVYETGCHGGDGEYKSHGESWMPDECTTCHCHLGEMSCQMEMCSVPCTYPRTVPGHCCPQCDDVTSFTLPPHCPLLHNCTETCQHGLQKGEDGCYKCQCKDFQCDLDCPVGFQYDPHGHKLCECRPPIPTIAPTCSSMESCQKSCIYGFKKDKQGCPRCRCNKCPAFHCKKKCPNGYLYNSMGCKLCRCMDTNATETTTTTVAPIVTTGPGCMSADGVLMEDGQAWYDGCRTCICLHGHEMCALITCPELQCRNLVFKPGDCCPSCAGDIKNLAPGLTTQCHSADKVYHMEGDTWQMDECTQCICHENGVLCEAEACPPVLCHHPIKLHGKCCPICGDDAPPAPPSKVRKTCRTERAHYKDGDSWRVSPCQSCTCRQGQIHCFSQTCPQLNCNKTVFKKGQCCPDCLGTRHHGVSRGNGTKPDVPIEADTDGQATVIILGIMVVLLMLTVFLLLLLLLRTRRKIYRVRDPIHSRHMEDGAIFLNKEKNMHLKSTNVDLQGNSPLPGEDLKLLHWADDPYGQVWKQDNLENEALQENKFKLSEDHLGLVPKDEEKDEQPPEEEEKEEESEEDDEKKLPISSDEDTASVASQDSVEKTPDDKADSLFDNDSTMPVSLEDRLQYNDLNFLLNGGCPTDTEVSLNDDPKFTGKDPLLNLFLYIPSDVDPNNFRKSV